MNSVELGALNAMSYCWNKHDDSFILARAVKAIAGVVKATFTKYTVSLIEAEAVMKRHPDAWFAEPVTWALAKYKITHATDTSRQPVTAGSPPPSSATAGSSPSLPQPPVNSPFSFSLKETDTTRVRFIDGFQTVADVKDAYKDMRTAAGDSWVANARLTCKQVTKDAVDDIAFNNKDHYAISKFLVTITHPNHRGESIEEVLHVMDKRTGQHKLVRIGSFCEVAGGSTTVGGGGFPGYSEESSTRAGLYLKNLKVKDQKGNDYFPYAQTRFGMGTYDGNNVGNMWSCGFDVLRLQLFQATGYKFSFQVLVAYLEEIISARGDAQELRRVLSNGHYPMSIHVMHLLLTGIASSSGYSNLLVEKRSVGEGRLTPDEREGLGLKSCTRQDILETTNWDYSSTAMICQPLYSFGIYRSKKSDGTFEYTVYDPHNFEGNPDFYASPKGQGRESFASAQDAINHVTGSKGGRNGKIDLFFRGPDAGLCFMRDRMMKTKGRLESEGKGF
ncbi:hypothetical protein [Endozoicomonas sp. GU-1]|uniref:hypothetical protein n=1 Tax=Endozoicomonas sp. GU-1 TaxID=3009078 RepID=UPI0022B3BA76|nr:hypothetical protein [Endozoicomonas sp. GU-1]WBA81353.1 hypothetical protein O2T12_24240 [Endozoicomonas sp. GU-1]WBA84301.1 hypothetical protein O3276_13410 [Endozoicomonas sp. GU-1]